MTSLDDPHDVPASAGGVWAYLAIARPDHWFKNAFMALGMILAWFYHPALFSLAAAGPILWALLAVCLVASSNYVLNEILDAPTDLAHPVKRDRPIPSGQVRLGLAYAEWLALGAAGLLLSWWLNRPFFYSALLLWVMGLIYNVPPIRSKELPYLDVLSESINNPLRLLLGWFAVSQAEIPPLSLMIFYWMIGAFFMATKRYAEYRSIAASGAAAAYRSSFRHYDESKLLISMFFYTAAAALFLGIFIIRYHLELILSVPLIAGFFSFYLYVAMKPNSPAQAPERLYRERGLMIYLVVCITVFVVLMFVRVPILYEWFHVRPTDVLPLWEF